MKSKPIKPTRRIFYRRGIYVEEGISLFRITEYDYGVQGYIPM